MRVQYKLFPYPVLCSEIDDYKNNKFEIEFNVSRDINFIKFNFQLHMEDLKLKNMIERGCVEIVYHIECAKTLYRKLYKTNKITHEINVKEKNLNGKVDICCFLVAKISINAYANDNFNEDYDCKTFEIKRGNILAFYNLPRIEFTKNTEELARISSIFSIIRRDDVEENGMDIELNSDKIKILLGNEEFSKYRDFAKSSKFQPMLHAMLVLPALIYAFDMILKDGEEEYESNRWFKGIVKTMSESGLKFTKEILEQETSYKLAQKLLNLPVNRALQNITNEEEED